MAFVMANHDFLSPVQFSDRGNIGVRAQVMNISLRHGQTRMAEPFLHRQHINAVSEPFRCRGMTQVMQPAPLRQLLPMRIPLYVPFVQFRAASRGEHQIIRLLTLQVFQDYRSDLIRDRHIARLAGFRIFDLHSL